MKFLVCFTDTPNVPDIDNGYFPIHVAAEMGHMDILKFLVPLCENRNQPDNDGNTPIDIARLSKHEDIVKYLESYSVGMTPNFPDIESSELILGF